MRVPSVTFNPRFYWSNSDVNLLSNNTLNLKNYFKKLESLIRYSLYASLFENSRSNNYLFSLKLIAKKGQSTYWLMISLL